MIGGVVFLTAFFWWIFRKKKGTDTPRVFDYLNKNPDFVPKLGYIMKWMGLLYCVNIALIWVGLLLLSIFVNWAFLGVLVLLIYFQRKFLKAGWIMYKNNSHFKNVKVFDGVFKKKKQEDGQQKV